MNGNGNGNGNGRTFASLLQPDVAPVRFDVGHGADFLEVSSRPLIGADPRSTLDST